MALQTIPTPAPPEAPDTYDPEDELTENYTTTAGTVSGTTTLELRISWPTVDDVTIPRFMVINPNVAAWSQSETSGTTYMDTKPEWITGMGGVHVECVVRVTGDDPLSTGDSSSHIALRRAIRAAVFDFDTAIKYVLENYLDGDGGTMPAIEPSWIFGMGLSAGGVTCNLHSKMFPTRRLAGAIVQVAGYGMDGVGTTPNTATDIVRDQLQFSYRHHNIPTCAFLGGADTTLGADRVTEFRTHLASRSDSIVHYDADGTHGTGWGTFDTTAITGADDEEEAIYNFVRARCAAIQPTANARRQYRTWARSWAKLQSRFW